jgi:hypothetical protein
MKDTFENRVRSAAIAGWWSLLIAAILITAVWIVTLSFLSSQPAWLLPFVGPGVTWAMLGTMILWFIGVLKLFLWLWLFAVLWLTLWAKQLRK